MTQQLFMLLAPKLQVVVVVTNLHILTIYIYFPGPLTHHRGMPMKTLNIAWQLLTTAIHIPNSYTNLRTSAIIEHILSTNSCECTQLHFIPMYMLPPVPPPIEPTPVLLSEFEVIALNQRTVTISVVPFNETNGLISHYQIIVVYLPSQINVADLCKPDIEFPQSSLGNYSEDFCSSIPSTPIAYVTAEMNSTLYTSLMNRYFVVGQNMDDDRSSPNDRPSLYTNGPLCYSTKFTFFVRAFLASTSGIVSSANNSRCMLINACIYYACRMVQMNVSTRSQYQRVILKL